MHRLTLRGRMTLLVLAGVLPLLGFHLASIYEDFQAERQEVARQALDLARSLAQVVESELDTRVAALEVLAMSQALANDDLVTFRAEAEAVLALQQPGASIVLLGEDGQQLMHTGLPPGAPLLERREIENRERVLATGQPAVSDLYFGVVARRPVISIDVPVRRRDGRLDRVLGFNPRANAFSDLIARQLQNSGWIISVTDRAGVRIAWLPSHGRHIGDQVNTAFRNLAAEHPAATYETTSPEGVPLIAAFSRIEAHGWAVAVGMPLTELTGPAWHRAMSSLAVGVGLLLGGLGLAQLVARGIIDPITALRRLATAADEGIPAPISTGLAETDDVARALLAEARRRRAALASLLDSERRLRLVVAELNHRAKNALATVQALAQQTARGEAGSDPALFTAVFNARLQSLARAHDLLAAFSWEAAALEAVVQAGLAPWLATGAESTDAPPQPGERPRIDINCGNGAPPAMASPGQAQALVLALHELATNAVKHGALSMPTGQVQVTCRQAEDGVGSVIEWRESGGPPVPGPPARGGFGTRLLTRALAHDLGPGGSVALEFLPSGVRATIHFRNRQHVVTGCAAG
jgi:two-component sensor histidine kinase